MNDGLRGAIADVLAFHKAMAKVYPEGADCDGRPGLTRRLQRQAWIHEEVRELDEAIAAGDIEAATDALLDIAYLCVGTGIMWVGSERMAACWDEVQRSNMAKRQPDGTVLVRPSDGKVQKPPGWVGPRIAEVLAGEWPEVDHGSD